jgi:predicted Zn-dependent protease
VGRGLLISLVFNYIFGSTGGDVVSGAVKLAELGHSRHDERQADDFGFRLAYANFGNADGYLDFFQKLRDEYESHDTHWLKFLNSHPPTGERLDDLKKLRDQLGER